MQIKSAEHFHIKVEKIERQSPEMQFCNSIDKNMHFSKMKRTDETMSKQTFLIRSFICVLVLQYTGHVKCQLDSQGDQCLIHFT